MPRRTRPRPRERPRSARLPVGNFRPEASAVHGVLRRHAMRDETGSIARCWPTLDEQRSGADAARDGTGRVAYRTRAAAESAGSELAAVSDERGRAVRRCPRVGPLGDHFHLAGHG